MTAVGGARAGGARAGGGAPRRVLVVWCPDWPPEEGAAARAFEQVVSVVEGFCPRVEVLRPGVCAVGARGPARYFGGEEILARKIIDAVTRRGFACQVGVADGLFAAQLAAQAAGTGREVAQSARAGPATAAQAAGRATPGAPPDRSRTSDAPDAVLVVAPGETPAFLAPHPVSALGNPDLADLLPRLGLRTMGEFAALSATEAANRFGVQGSLAHRLARGLDPRPLAPRPPAADLSVSVAFDPPSEQAEPVVFAAKTLAEQMHASLAAKGLACVRVGVQVTGTDGQEITRLWRHDGLLSALAVAERVRWQLAGWRAAQDADERSSARRDHAAAADPGPAGARRGPSARPMGRRGDHRPGGPRRDPGPGPARAQRGDPPGAGRGAQPGRAGDPGAVRRRR